MPHKTALITLIAVIVYFGTAILVARTRRATGIKAPAMSGHPDLERALRVQMNMLEWMPIFLPALWLAALYVSDRWASVIGAVWIVGRILYARGYMQAADQRRLGFSIQAFSALALWLTALYGVAMALLR